MKVNIIRKFKWYIVGFILVVIMLSVGLSFCTWDDYSLKAVSADGKTGNYGLYELAEDKYSDDNFTKGSNNIANIGDIVTFGKYYQTADNTLAKTALRWIVVEKQGTTLTLLAENVVAFGSFWGTFCYDLNNNGVWGSTDANYQTYYQNYEQSTVRAWLNSNYTLRNDGGTAFAQSESGVFKGFLNDAFSTEEQEYIIAQNISGMRGAVKGASTKENYNAITGDKVWIPSYTQVYGKDAPDGSWKECNDGSQNPTDNIKFSYFDNTSNSKVGKTTAFASSSASNYTYRGKTIGTQNWQNSSAGSAVWWWLRSPYPSDYVYALNVHSSGTYSNFHTDNSRGGVRPAVCVPL